MQPTSEDLHELLRISARLYSSLDANEIVDLLVQEAIALTDAESGCGGLSSAEGLTCQKCFWESGEAEPFHYTWPPGKGLPGWLLINKKPYLTNDAGHDREILKDIAERFRVRSVLSTPVMDGKNEVIGFFELHNKKSEEGFTDEDMEKLVLLSNAASAAIENAICYRDLARKNEQTEKMAQFIQAMLDASPLVIKSLDVKGKVRTWNRAAEEMYGWKAEEVIGNFLPTVPEGAQREFEERLISESLKGAIFRKVEVIRRRKDGSTVEMELWTAPIYDHDHVVTGAIHVLREVTEEKIKEKAHLEMQRALQQTSQTLQSLFEASPVAIITLDSGANVKMWNQAAERLFGWSALEVIGKPLPIIAPDQMQAFRALFEEEMKGRMYSGLELRRMKKDSSLVDVSLWTAPFHDANGDIAGVIGMFIDITDRKKAEEQLRSSREQLRALSVNLQFALESERHAIAREIHDELGQMLTGLKMDLSWLNANLRDDQKTLSEKMQSAIELMDSLIQSVRRISSRLRPGELDDYGLSTATELYVGDFERRTGIKCEFISSLEEAGLDRDLSTAVFRILQESLTNVARHAQATKVNITLEENQGKLRLLVEDNGTGIMGERISSRRSLGILGMSERARAFGGMLTVSGTPGKGTAVILEVPVREEVK